MRKRFIANDGENSKYVDQLREPIKTTLQWTNWLHRRTKLFGNNADNIVIQVPAGITAVTDSGVVLGELDEVNQEIVVARGGKGGSSANGYMHEMGQKFSVNLDLKLIADIGLIGFPNAGKSTFLSLVSRAQPKIANYPCKWLDETFFNVIWV